MREDKVNGCFTRIAMLVIFPASVIGLAQYIFADFLATSSISAVACIGALLLVFFVGTMRSKPKLPTSDVNKLRLDGGKRK